MLPGAMTSLDSLQKHFSRYAIPGLIRYVVALNALVFILVTLLPEYADVLSIDRSAILNGELWRLVSWIFIPNTMSPFWVLFYLIFTWWIGDMLEENWGAFRLNAYYFLGMMLCIGSALVFGASGGNFFLNLSLFLAVATLAPNFEIMLFLIIPVKIKWVALFSLLLPALYLITGPLSIKMMVIMCLGNYVLFFGPSFLKGRMESRKTSQRRERFNAASSTESTTLHRCEQCAATEHSHPEKEFRVTAEGKEFCIEHLPGKQA